jgi:ABC-type glycerol-3-phosphate transport system substrate-binding protein
MKTSRIAAVVLLVGALGMSGCSNKAADEGTEKALWKSSSTPPADYVQKQMAARAAAEAKRPKQ